MITDYSSLKTSVARWLGRSNLTSDIPEFISLAEATMRRRLRRTRKRASVTFNAEAFTLPLDCAELTSAHLVTGLSGLDRPLDLGTPEQLAQHRSQFISSGYPRQAAVVGRELLLSPTPLSALSAEITYYEKLVPLSDSATTNATLTESPDLYLYGTLLEAAPFLENDERIAVWQSRFDKVIDEMNLAREREEYGASLQPIRLPVVF